MSNTGKYLNLWSSKVSIIVDALKNPQFGKSVQLDKAEFQRVGNRQKYSFNIDLKNGVVQKGLSGSAVARDLVSVMENSAPIRELLKNAHVKISMNTSYMLNITKMDSHYDGFQ